MALLPLISFMLFLLWNLPFMKLTPSSTIALVGQLRPARLNCDGTAACLTDCAEKVPKSVGTAGVTVQACAPPAHRAAITATRIASTRYILRLTGRLP